MKTNWYTKQCNSNRLLNFESYHPLHMKIAIVEGLTSKMLKLSDHIFHSENFKKIKKMFNENNYPNTFINQIFNRTKQKFTTQQQTKQQQNISYLKFPYIKNISFNINKIFKEYNFQLAYYNVKSTNIVYTKLKSKIPKTSQSCLIYKIPCNDCNACYIGQTKQYLKNRIRQHSYDCNDKNSVKIEKTALADHHFIHNHNFNFEDTIILDKEINGKRRNLSEMVFININNTVNKRSDTEGLSKIYSFILDKYKNQIP